MEKLLLGLLLAGDKLHVVHQQQRRLAIFLPELGVLALPDGGHQLVGEVVALDIDDLRVRPVLLQPVSDGVEQVSLAQTRVPIDEQGVIVGAGPFGHGVGGGIGQLVAGAHHIGLKGERARVLQIPRIVGPHAVIGRQLVVV